MIAALLAKLGAKVGVWAAAIGTLAAAVFGLIAYGKHKQRATDLADAAQ